MLLWLTANDWFLRDGSVMTSENVSMKMRLIIHLVVHIKYLSESMSMRTQRIVSFRMGVLQGMYFLARILQESKV